MPSSLILQEEKCYVLIIFIYEKIKKKNDVEGEACHVRRVVSHLESSFIHWDFSCLVLSFNSLQVFECVYCLALQEYLGLEPLEQLCQEGVCLVSHFCLLRKKRQLYFHRKMKNLLLQMLLLMELMLLSRLSLKSSLQSLSESRWWSAKITSLSLFPDLRCQTIALITQNFYEWIDSFVYLSSAYFTLIRKWRLPMQWFHSYSHLLFFILYFL